MNSTTKKKAIINQRANVFWLTGLSGAGKSTLAREAEKILLSKSHLIKVLDGDEIRMGINNDLGFSAQDRMENIRRSAEIAKLFLKIGISSIVSFITPFIAARELARKIIGDPNFYEIYINASLSTCEERDTKNLYKQARAGNVIDFTGINSPYEPPLQPALEINTSEQDINECATIFVNFILEKSEL